MNSDRSILVARAESGPGTEWTLRAPAVGVWVDPPDEGRLVGTDSPVGRLLRLGRSLELRLPELPPGRVRRICRRRQRAVGYLDTLFQIVPIDLAAVTPVGASGPAAEAAGSRDTATWSVVAPTEGVFYRRMEPGAAPLVEVGARVRVGQPIGLIEVMKTYNQIVFGGRGAPAEGEVLEIRVGDGEEVTAGQVLVVVQG